MTATKEKQLAAIEAEMRDIMRQVNALPNNSPKQNQLIDRGRKLVAKARPLRLSLLIGKQVTRRIKWHDNKQLNDRTGTLLAVRRAKCDVDYGDLGVWTMSISNVMPADSSQSWGAEY